MIKYKDIIVYAKFDDGKFRNAFGVELVNEINSIEEKYKLRKVDFAKLEAAVAVAIKQALEEIEKRRT